jgi:hypothetical protein
VSSEEIVGEWPDAEEYAAVGEPVEAVAERCRFNRPVVVEVLQSVEVALGEDATAWVRASDLDTDLDVRTVGSVLGLLADSPATVAQEYEIPEALRLDVKRWGRSSSATRWEVSWADA